MIAGVGITSSHQTELRNQSIHQVINWKTISAHLTSRLELWELWELFGFTTRPIRGTAAPP